MAAVVVRLLGVLLVATGIVDLLFVVEVFGGFALLATSTVGLDTVEDVDAVAVEDITQVFHSVHLLASPIVEVSVDNRCFEQAFLPDDWWCGNHRVGYLCLLFLIIFVTVL